MFDAREERDRRRLTETLPTPGNEVSPGFPLIDEEVSPVVESATNEI